MEPKENLKLNIYNHKLSLTNMSETFFITPQNSNTCIDLIDASGSTTEFMGNIQVFDIEMEICKKLQHKEHRVIFWNGDKGAGFGETGISKWPAPVPNTKLDIVFNSTKQTIRPGFLTKPHLGFRAIDDWLKTNYSTVINFITDGEIGWGSISSQEKNSLINELVDSIKYINKTYPDVQINIFAVERDSMIDYSVAESMNGVVGNDVYTAISKNGLTSMISKFITFSRVHPNGHAHINKIKTPVGFIPYGERYFSILSTSQFITYIAEQVGIHKNNQMELLKIIQDLSVSLNVLTKDKPKPIREKTINIFCNIFANTNIDDSMVKILLTRAIEAESAGSAQLNSDYRANLKSLYADADRALRNNVADAVKIENRSISLPMPTSDNCAIFLTYKTPNRSILGYSNGGFEFNGRVVPILPMTYKSNLMTGQCIRQWIRFQMSKLYNINSTSDEVIFIMMMINLQAKLMKLDSGICQTYKMLVGVLLEKKRANVQLTEMENLLKGNLFIPNDGNINNFTTYLTNVAKRFDIQMQSPLELWYHMCGAYSEELSNSQYIHCKTDLTTDSSYLNPTKQWIVCDLPEELNYQCLVTINSTTMGGYKINAHDVAKDICSPKYVFSEEGMNQILSKPETSLCPICYTRITSNNFSKVPPLSDNVSVHKDLLINDIFGGTTIPPAVETSNSSSSSSSSSSGDSNNVLVCLKGTVGSGKTTYAKKLQKIAQDAGYLCIIEGTDQYMIDGMNIKSAINKIKQNLNNIRNSRNPKKMVIIDTCGERSNPRDVFGVDFSSWTVRNIFVNYDSNQQVQYLAWSLRNVITRDTNSAVLTVGKTSLPVCIDVHYKKASALFNNVKQFNNDTSMVELLQKIESDADDYAKYLEANKNIYEPSL